MYYEISNKTLNQTRSSEDGKFWSIADTIAVYSPKLGAQEVSKIASRCMEELEHHCCLHHKMAFHGDGSQGWSSCLAIDYDYLPELLSMLWVEEGKRFSSQKLTTDESTINRRQFIESNSSRWEAVGRIFQSRREDLGLSAQVVATALGVSPSLIRKFERGMPIRRASLVENAYRYFLKFHGLTQTSFGHLNKGMEDWEQAQFWLHLSDEDEEFDANQPWPNSDVG